MGKGDSWGQEDWGLWEEKGKVVMAQRQRKGQAVGWRTGYIFQPPLAFEKKKKRNDSLLLPPSI